MVFIPLGCPGEPFGKEQPANATLTQKMEQRDNLYPRRKASIVTVAKTDKQTRGILLALLAAMLLAALLAWQAMAVRMALAEEGAVAEAPAVEEVQPAPEATPEATPVVTTEQPLDSVPVPEEAVPAAEPVAENPLDLSKDSPSLFGNDLLWAGNEHEFVGEQVLNDLLAAGQTITVKDSQVFGDIRLAGRVLTVSNTGVGQSVTLAGQDVHVTGGSANAVALAGQSATFEGTTNTLYLTASDAYINGVVNGDVYVLAGKVRIGPAAQIMGTLRGETGQEPTIDAGAMIVANELKVNAAGQQEDASAKTSRLPDWKVIVFSLLSTVATALIAEWLAGGHTKHAGDLLTEFPGAFIGFGIMWSLLLPVVIALLCIPIVTIPVALAALFALVALGLVSVGFTAAALGRMLFPKAGRFVIVAIMGLAFGLLSVVPYVSWVVRVLSCVFTVGYVTISIREGMRKHAPDGGQPHLPYASTYTD